MLPLDGSDFPASLDALTTALRQGLEKHGFTVAGLQASGGNYPLIDELRIDLSGTALSRDTRLPAGANILPNGVKVGTTKLSASPLLLEGTPLDLRFQSENLALNFARSATNEPLLHLGATGTGSLSLEVPHQALEAALEKFAKEAAAKQGAEIKSTRLHFTQRGPRGLEFRGEVTAKVFVMSAVLVVSGEVDINEQLDLRLHHLTVSGDGMVANLAATALRPRLAELEKRTFPLSNAALAGVTLNDVQLSCARGLRVEARFGA